MECFIKDFDIRLDMDPITYGIALQVLKKTGPFIVTMGENSCHVTRGEGIKSLASLAHYTKQLMVIFEEIDRLAKTAYDSLKGAKNPFDVPEKKSD